MITTATLPNGLRVLTVPMASAATVSLMVMVRGGSRFETRDITGISHFMEHMFFKGGKKYPTTQDVSRTIDALGGEFNAFTDYEEVAYYVKVAADHLPVAFDVIADMLLHATVPEEEVDRERNVVYEELNMYEDTPMRRVGEIAQRLMYGDHPLGWEIGGSKESLAGVHRKELLAFREAYYRPENMLVVAAGKVDPQEFTAFVEKNLPLAGDGGVSDPLPFAGYAPERVRLYPKKTEQAHLAIMTPAPRLGADDETAVKVLSSIFGGSMSSRLFTSIRERQGLCYYIRSSHTPFTDTGDISITAGVSLDKIDQAVTSILAEMRRIHAEGVTAQELTDGIAGVKGRLAIGLEDTASMAEAVGSRAIRLGTVESLEEKLARFAAVTHEQVNQAATRFLDPAQAKLAVVGPYEDAAHFESLLS